MYRIDRTRNAIEPLRLCSFSELGFRERTNLQEWIAKEPGILGEDLLIIQKEFAGFSDTNERLDLLALDKEGSLVVIENKLDDAGRDVTWQALKYASYCAGLTRDNIRAIYQDYLSRSGSDQDAVENLCDFFDVDELDELALNKGVTQRIILVAGRFRKEVTSTVVWLLNFKIRLQCFRATPYASGDELFLNVAQIIPTQEAEDFMIGLAEKAQDEIAAATADKTRYALRQEFWRLLFSIVNRKTDLFANITPSTRNWVPASSGTRGVSFNFVVTRDGVKVELYIDRGDKSENERMFDELALQRDAIDPAFGDGLVWERLDGKKACRVTFERPGNVFERDSWPQLADAMADAMIRLEKAMQGPLQRMKERPRANGT